MSADTITTALFLITAVIAAGVLINAIYPVVYNMAGTFSSATHESDQRLRTDFKIVLITANGTTKYGTAWMKNVGSAKISMDEIQRSDVFCGAVGEFKRLDYNSGTSDQWIAVIREPAPANNFWDPGETLEIQFEASSLPATSSTNAYFQLVLPNGIWRSTEFTVN
ncbi:flagellin [uncultured Methanoregula sp.]|uniref:flagellin n=1 Tax=uncultured Methanoregula sp. TaxID=1005933 RepID=UPI002AABCB59|nr:flagellin [uncultured Methanoregula sp.]